MERLSHTFVIISDGKVFLSGADVWMTRPVDVPLHARFSLVLLTNFRCSCPVNAGPTGDNRVALSNELINFPSRSYSSYVDRCARQKHVETRLLNASQVNKITRRIYGCPLPLYNSPQHWSSTSSLAWITLCSRVIHEKLSLLTCSRNSSSLIEPECSISCHRLPPWPRCIYSIS
jgi:hypothetical protein